MVIMAPPPRPLQCWRPPRPLQCWMLEIQSPPATPTALPRGAREGREPWWVWAWAWASATHRFLLYIVYSQPGEPCPSLKMCKTDVRESDPMHAVGTGGDVYSEPIAAPNGSPCSENFFEKKFFLGKTFLKNPKPIARPCSVLKLPLKTTPLCFGRKSVRRAKHAKMGTSFWARFLSILGLKR